VCGDFNGHHLSGRVCDKEKKPAEYVSSSDALCADAPLATLGLELGDSDRSEAILVCSLLF
jgi:hypothetical protein